MNVAKRMTGIAACLALVAGAGHRTYADASAQVDVASHYVFRGMEVSDNAAVFGNAEIAAHGFTFGTWAWVDTDSDIDNDVNEVDLTLAYEHSVDSLTFGVGLIEYLYPAGGPGDREIFVSIGCSQTPLNPTLSVYYGLEGTPDKDLYVVLSLSHTLAVAENLGLTLGGSASWWDRDATGERGFAEGTLSAELALSLNENTTLLGTAVYSTNLEDDVLTDAEAFDDVWGSISVSCSI
jgi:uncharacterized protein (TIGR02001 family)